MSALNRKVLLSLFLALGAFSALAWLTMKGFEGLMASSARLQSAHRVLARLESGLRHISMAQAGQRDFLLTGDSGFLEACQAELFGLDGDLQVVRKANKDPELTGRIDALDPLLVAQVEFFKRSFELRQAQGAKAAAELIKAQGAEASLDRLFGLANGLLAFETGLVDSQSNELQDRFLELRRGLLIGAAVALLLVFVLVTLVHREMARRGNAEDALSHEHQLVRTVMDGMAESVLVLNAAGQLISYNPAALRLFGRALLEWPLEQWAERLQVTGPDEKQPLPWNDLALSRALRAVPTDEQEVFVRTPQQPDGIHLSLNGRPLLDARGVLTGAVAVCRDISAHRARVQLLHADNQELRDSVGQLERQNSEISHLSTLVEAMQASQSLAELGAAAGPLLAPMFEGVSGSVLMLNPSRTHLKRLARFGERVLSDHFPPQDCWALRRGHPHYTQGNVAVMVCAHLDHRPHESLCLPLMAQGELLGLLHMVSEKPTFNERRQKLAGVVAEQLSLAMANIGLRERLKNQSSIDPLTGLFNRRHMEEAFEREMARSVSAGLGLGLVMVDVDHFKQFNDRFGHDAGDQVLKQIAATLRACTRPSDLVCRYGGEELLVLLPGIQREQALARAEACRKAVEGLELYSGGRSLGRVTASFGVAAGPEDGSGLDELVKRADQALYRAKAAGRNQVVSAAGLGPTPALV
jgi:diguanylate cyclase (GGDEF)-like protein